MWSRLSRTAGRRAFGRDPAAYDAARPEYPARLFSILQSRCGLQPGARVLEIGGGTGLATREMLRRGAAHVTVVEPDRRLARYLVRSLGRDRTKVTVVGSTFEAARLPRGGFDLGASATAFHWLDERRALRKVARLLRPGGWWAAWWNVYGDPLHPSPFQRAIDPMFHGLPSGPSTPIRSRLPHALDRAARERALRRTGQFRRISSLILRRSIDLPSARLAALYATYAPIATLPLARRRRFLEGLIGVADTEFRGRVGMRVITPLYTAQRVPHGPVRGD